MFFLLLELDENGKPTTQAIGSFIARSAGGTHNAQPSWELLAVYEMTNGKTIDEPGSGFDPHDPFANRDPRCLETFAAPGSRIYGIEWNPAPNALEVMDYTQNRMITNKDSKGGSDASNCCLLYTSIRTYCVRKHFQTDANEASRNSADFPMQTPHDAHDGALCAMLPDRLS